MNPRITPYLILFIFSLSGAYWASLPKKRSSGERSWLVLKERLSSLSYINPSVKVEIDFSSSWVRVFSRKNGKITATDEFLASKAINDLREKMADVKARKVIGSYEKIDSGEYGFEGEEKTILSLNTTSEIYEFEVGKRSFQSSDVYLRDMQRQEVILSPNKAINIVINATSRLFKRNIVDFKLSEDVSHIDLSFGGRDINLIPSKEGGGNVMWRITGQTTAHESLSNWLKRFVGLKLKKYADESQVFDGNQVFSASFQLNSGSRESVTISLKEDKKHRSQYWLKSSGSPRHVLLDPNRTKTLLRDLENFSI